MSLETILKPIEAIDNYLLNTAQSIAKTFHFDNEKRIDYINKGLHLFNLSAGLLLEAKVGITLLGINLIYTFSNNYEKQENLKSVTAQSLLEKTNRIIRLTTVGVTAALYYYSHTYTTSFSLDESTPIPQSDLETVLLVTKHSIELATLGFGLLATRIYLTNFDYSYTKPPQPNPTTKEDPNGWIRYK